MGDVVREARSRLERAMGASAVTVRLDLQATHPIEDHVAGPLVTLLLCAARYVEPGGTLRIRSRDRAGGDVEILVDGLRLPEEFPGESRDADLWALASRFLREFHRARLGHSGDRVLLLVPGRDRARRLRAGHDQPVA